MDSSASSALLAVDLLQFLRVRLLDGVSLHLLRAGQQAGLGSERLVDDEDALDLLDLGQLVRVCHSLQLLQDTDFDVLQVQQLGQVLLEIVHEGELLEFLLVEVDDGDQELVVAIDVYIDLVDDWSLQVDALEFLRRDELTVLQFHHFLDSVNQLEGTVLLQDGNITQLEPALLGKDLLGQVWSLEVALEHGVTFNVELSGGWLSVGGKAHFWDVSQLGPKARKDTSDGTALDIPVAGTGKTSSRLRGSICLEYWSTEDDGEELLDIWLHWSTTRNHELDTTSEDLSEEVEKERVVNRVGEVTGLNVLEDLVLDGLVHEGLDEVVATLNVLLYLLVDFTVKSWE